MLELGSEAPALHRQVGTLAGKTGAVRLFAYGQHAEDLIAGAHRAGMPSERLAVAAKEEIVAFLLGELRAGDWLLVKGSRGMAMETIVTAVLDWARKEAGHNEGGRNILP
jgi:UDP-N-acetylmuramoyl-tripeptide--D-alanyl-D-alanine ligase